MQRFLKTLLTRDWQGFRVCHHAVLPASEACCEKLKAPLPEALRGVLADMSIPELYQHQATAIDTIRSGDNVVVATPTSSGKSLIYNLAVTETILADPGQSALYLFP